VSSSGWLSFVLALLLLGAVATGVGGLGRLRTGQEVVLVVARAIVQLIAVAFVIKIVFTTAWLAPFYLTAMVAVAAGTSSRRLRKRGVERALWPAVAAISGGAAVTVAVVAGTAALPLRTNQLVPFAAQIIGGAMTATTLASLRMLEDISAHWDEVEGWLALGASGRVAVAELGRRAASAALVPALDQTRNVGLVVLPGAFVGLLLAGATPLEAGRLQLLVLVGLLCAESIAVLVATTLLGGILGTHRPGEPSRPAAALPSRP
jgi:putative ABC transport system permease protein